MLLLDLVTALHQAEARIHHHRVVNHILQALRAPILLDQVVA